MLDALLTLEAPLRLSVFGGFLILFGVLEALFPRRERRHERLVRWPANLSVTLLNVLCIRLLFPVAGVGLALLLEQGGYGLFNLVSVPPALAIVMSIIALDLAIYWQHVIFHRVPLLWRIHRMHHTDTDLDVTSGVRFHPVEILLSMLIKLALIGLLGAPAVAVMLFEIILNASAMFNHANLNLPLRTDRWLRWLIVTPDMHRIHHSVRQAETDSNYGFNLSCWDRLFETYIEEPENGQTGMSLGLTEYRDAAEQRIDRMLTLPFRT